MDFNKMDGLPFTWTGPFTPQNETGLMSQSGVDLLEVLLSGRRAQRRVQGGAW